MGYSVFSTANPIEGKTVRRLEFLCQFGFKYFIFRITRVFNVMSLDLDSKILSDCAIEDGQRLVLSQRKSVTTVPQQTPTSNISSSIQSNKRSSLTQSQHERYITAKCFTTSVQFTIQGYILRRIIVLFE